MRRILKEGRFKMDKKDETTDIEFEELTGLQLNCSYQETLAQRQSGLLPQDSDLVEVKLDVMEDGRFEIYVEEEDDIFADIVTDEDVEHEFSVQNCEVV